MLGKSAGGIMKIFTKFFDRLFSKKKIPKKPRNRPVYGRCLACNRVVAINQRGVAYPHKVIRGGQRCLSDHGYDLGWGEHDLRERLSECEREKNNYAFPCITEPSSGYEPESHKEYVTTV